MGSTLHRASGAARGPARPLEARSRAPRASTFAAWLKASRLASQSYIALPLLLGQALAAHATGVSPDVPTLVLVQLFGVFDQLYIVYANDVADAETDRDNATPTIFSGGSRVLVEGAISASALTQAAGICAALALVVSAVLCFTRDTLTLVPLALVGLGLLWAYSFPPLRLSYRGGGELLQAAGVGLVLPLYGFVAQSGSLAQMPWSVVLALLPAQLACSVATALPDEPSDRRSAKRTLAVRIGGRRAADVAAALLLVSTTLLALALRVLTSGLLLALLVPTALAVGVLFLRAATPGTRALVLRVALAVGGSLSLVVIALLATFLSAGPR